MPTYEYECSKCGYTFDVMQKISEKPIKKCPKCSGKVKKLINPTAFILKGSGWYITDYARKGKDSKGEPKVEKSDEKPKVEKDIKTTQESSKDKKNKT